VDREIRAARLVGDRCATRVVRWSDARRDGGKLHEVAAVEREGNDTLALDDLAERGGFTIHLRGLRGDFHPLGHLAELELCIHADRLIDE